MSTYKPTLSFFFIVCQIINKTIDKMIIIDKIHIYKHFNLSDKPFAFDSILKRWPF